MTPITSTQNEKIRFIRSLKDGGARTEAGLFLVEGRKLCEESLRDARVTTLLVDIEKADTLSAIWQRFGEPLFVAPHVLSSVCETKTPQGIIAVVQIPPPLLLEAADGPLLALDGVQDPGNVGAMLRTAEAAGFAGALLCPACADAFSPKAARASMGSVLRLPIARESLPGALARLSARGFSIISAELGGVLVDQAQIRAPYALVIGSEGSGVSAEVSAIADMRVSLPMRGRAESLNAAVAAGILMYLLGTPPCS